MDFKSRIQKSIISFLSFFLGIGVAYIYYIYRTGKELGLRGILIGFIGAFILLSIIVLVVYDIGE
jgi:hypothetical protein